MLVRGLNAGVIYRTAYLAVGGNRVIPTFCTANPQTVLGCLPAH